MAYSEKSDINISALIVNVYLMHKHCAESVESKEACVTAEERVFKADGIWTWSLPVFSVMAGTIQMVSVRHLQACAQSCISICSPGWCWCPIRPWIFSLSYLQNLHLASAFLLFLYLAVTRPALHLPLELIFPALLSLFWCPTPYSWTYMHIHSLGSIWHKWADILHSSGYMFVVI